MPFRAFARAWFPATCASCGAVWAGGTDDDESDFCAPCRETIVGSPHPDALYAFAGALKNTLGRAKFGPEAALAGPLERLAVAAPRWRTATFDYVTYVPVHRRRLLRRGFDVSGRVAAALARAQGCRLIETLRCVRYEAPRAMSEARPALAGKFVSTGARPPGVGVLIDDVRTSGATFTEAQRVLSADGTDVFPVALAATPTPQAP